MRYLIPVDFADLGPAEFAWLVLVFGGLSLLAPARRRLVAAAIVCGLMALFGLARLLAGDAGASAWDRFGPIVVTPLGGAGLVLLGLVRERLRGHAVAGIWIGALVLLSVLAQPFGIARYSEWFFLLLLGVAVAALVQGEGPARAFLGRGRRAWWFAIVFLLLCGFTEPFGVTWLGGLGLLVFLWIVYAVLAQGPEMRKFVLRRLVGAPVVLVVLLVLSFVLMRFAPGGPYDQDKRRDPEVQKALEARYGLHEPLRVQFYLYMKPLLWEGDLGESTKQKGSTVNEIIQHHAAASARLGLAAIALALFIGLTAGLISGIRQNSIFDYASMTGAMIGLALPTFVVGPMLVLLFAMKIPWFDVSGWDDPKDLVLPAVTLSLPFAARIARLTRAGMLEIVNQDYIRTARAKGLSEPVIVLRHTLKGTLLPVVSFLGPAVAQLLVGSLVVETIFNVPGLGTEFVQSALNRDYNLAMGLVVLFGTLLIGFNLIVDVAYGFLDPRIRHA